MPIQLRGKRHLEDREGEPLEIGSLEPAEGLSPSAEETVRIGHLSDFHLGKPLDGGSVPEFVEEWLEAFRSADVDLLVCSGDLVERPDDRVGMLRIRHLFEQSGIPWVVVPGNHDVARPGAGSPFYELFGDYPRAEQVGGAEVVLLDSIGGLPVDERSPFDRLEAQLSGAYSRGRVGHEELAVAESELRGGGELPRVLVVHHHLWSHERVVGEPPGPKLPTGLMVPCLDAETVMAWARQIGVRVAFHGHVHEHWPPYAPEEGPAVLNSGSSTRGRPAPRARIVDLEPDRQTVWEFEMTPAEAPT